VFIRNSKFEHNGSDGVWASDGIVTAVTSVFSMNGGNGVNALACGADTHRVTVVKSKLSGNALSGANVGGGSSCTTGSYLHLDDDLVADNVAAGNTVGGIEISSNGGPNSYVWLSRTAISGHPTRPLVGINENGLVFTFQGNYSQAETNTSWTNLAPLGPIPILPLQ
jgi:hypothetical protein